MSERSSPVGESERSSIATTGIFGFGSDLPCEQPLEEVVVGDASAGDDAVRPGDGTAAADDGGLALGAAVADVAHAQLQDADRGQLGAVDVAALEALLDGGGEVVEALRLVGLRPRPPVGAAL